VARGFVTTVGQPSLDRLVTVPGLPIRFTGTPGQVRPAPGPGQHQHLLDDEPTEPTTTTRSTP
jgi:crotonobetainyl-CoA:carnitine CoA-transferase CaiB-like acyl-CoA transferase